MRDEDIERARALVGCAFRPQGRSRKIGLDCVGMTLEVYAIEGDFRRDYRLRGDHRQELEAALRPHFRAVSRSHINCGDLMLWAVASDQFHLTINLGSSFIHADAALRRVVETPGIPPWPLVRAYLKRTVRPRIC